MRDSDGFYRLTPKKYTIEEIQKRELENKIIFRHGHIAITNYRMGDNREFEKSLSVWDDIRWKYEMKGGYYIKRLREFRINRGYDVTMLSRFFPYHKPGVDNKAYPSDEINIKLVTGPRNDFQRVALTFMAGQGEFKSNLKYTQQIIDMPTGSGKTYCGAAATCFLRARTIVIMPFAKLLEQWRNTYLQFTSLEEKDILIVQGSNICKKIIEGKYKDVKVFLFMSDTIDSFTRRFGALETIELLRSTRAYLKIVDEVHRDMKSIAMIEAVSNFRMNYYMSASPGRADKKENWIFKTLFKNIPRFGSDFIRQDEKHINVIIKKYEFIPHQQQINKMINRRKQWLNTKEYENQLFEAPPAQRASFDNSVRIMLEWAKRQLKPGNKILILTSTINGTSHIKTLADEIFPGETARYYGSMPSKEEKAQALTKTVIAATSSSLGTGADIAGVQFCFNCTTYSNKIEAVQTSGRLRKLSDGAQSVYCEFVNMSWIKTVRQYEKRKPYLIQRAKTGKLVVID